MANGDIQQAMPRWDGSGDEHSQSTRIPGDYGLLTAIGETISSTVWELAFKYSRPRPCSAA